MNSVDKKIGQRIARQRRIAGLTQAQLAEKLGVQPESISRIETGRRTPSLAFLWMASEVLEIEAYELLRVGRNDGPKERALERLHWFASRLSLRQIELVLSMIAVVLKHEREGGEP